ncbi:MAG: metal-sulfur cluster assembly factor [Candidatus Diapherotrites archaeon]|nr:metal-sulfur cluster assembly factor [Candidatus Diapherotrites archaeon]
MVSEQAIIRELKKVIDPEIGINVIDLGLIYDISVSNDAVSIKMTVTNPYCPLQEHLKQLVENALSSIRGIKEASVELVFDPPWTPERLSPKAKKELGFG